ncbi:MAG: hypothetical protein FWG31_03975 [Oscillospiraceae bacterium]|nr:hypothetical protein [Oscillospiraceae bacterium]
MTNEPKAVREVHEIRLKLQEQTKNMTILEEIAFYNNAVTESEKRRGRMFKRPDSKQIRKVI